MTVLANRYSKHNNKYLGDYDKNKESSYLIYLDANNPYGWAMSAATNRRIQMLSSPAMKIF